MSSPITSTFLFAMAVVISVVSYIKGSIAGVGAGMFCVGMLFTFLADLVIVWWVERK